MYTEYENNVYHFTPLKKDLYISEFGHMRWAGKRRVNPYMRNVYFWHFTVSGEMVFCNTPINAGQGVLIAARKVQSIIFNEGENEQFWIGFGGERAKELIDFASLPAEGHGVFEIKNMAYVEKMLRLAFEECKRGGGEEAAMSALLSVFPFMSVKKGVEPEEKGYFEAAVSLMKRNHYRSISMESIAKQVNISEKHLCRIFKEKCGLSPKQYMTKLRMEAARKMLVEADLRVKEVARIEGYSSQGAFTQAFTNYFGISPSKMKELGY